MRKFSYPILLSVLIFTSCSNAGEFSMAPKIKKYPNIIMIAIDTLRQDHLGCYGYNRPVSPNIDKFAGQGALFEKTYSAASWTLPSFTSIFTGLLPSAHNVTSAGDKLLPAIPTFTEQLKVKGYYCTAIVSNPCAAGKYGLSKGFDLYDDYSINLGAELGMFAVNYSQDMGPVNDVVTSDSVTQQAILQLDSAKKTNKPFFLFALFFDLHDSYIPPAPLDTKFDPDYQGKMDGKNVNSMRNAPPPERDIYNLIARYDGEISYTDRYVGKLLSYIDKISKPEDTVIIIVSDHGEAFTEHNMLLHGNSAYREEVCVPMIWRWTGVIPAGRRVKSLVMNMDIAKTLSELLHCDEFKLVQSKSLWPRLLEEKEPQESCTVVSQKACAGNTPLKHLALTKDFFRLHLKFKESPDEKDALCTLYDISKDPWEQNNVSILHRNKTMEMITELRKVWKESKEIYDYYLKGGKGEETKLTPEDRRRLETMGYLNKTN